MKNLQAEMKRNGLSVMDISRVIHRTERSTRDKVNGNRAFTFPEVIAIRDAFFPSMRLEYLFNDENNCRCGRKD